MSSPHRYQSRLFQTMRSQFCQIKDNAQLRWRQLKVAMTWGAQVSLYPFYLLFQAGRWSGQVLRQTVANVPRLLASVEPEIPVDQPIQNVLDAVGFFSLLAAVEQSLESVTLGESHPSHQVSIRPIAPAQPVTWVKRVGALWQRWRGKVPTGAVSLQMPTAEQVMQPPKIQGVASCLTHRRLVLVTGQNQVLDVLSPDQQHQLQQRIVWEVAYACYRQRHRSFRKVPAWQTWQALPLPVKSEWSLPIRALYRLMAWVQPVTQKPLMPEIPERSNAQDTGHQPQTVLEALRQLGLPLRQFYSSALVRLSPQALGVEGGTSSPMEGFGKLLRGYRTVLTAGVAALALLPFTLVPEPAQAASPVLPMLPHSLPSPLTAEWLIDPSRSRKRGSNEAECLEQSGRPSQGKVRIAPEKTAAALSAEAFKGAVGDWANRFSQATVSAGSPALEVDAVFMGYEHHPLEVLLLWLDQATAWIEIHLTKLWQRWQPILHSWIRTD